MFGYDVDEFLNINSLVLHVPGGGAQELPVDKFIIYAYNKKYAQPQGESDLKSAYSHWRIKRALIDQWNAHLEKYASPAIVGKFERGLSEEEQAALLDSLDKVQRQSALIHPDDIEVSLLDGRRAAESGYLEAIDYHNREIARAILGQTLTTDDSRKIGSLALGKVHLQVLIMQLNGLRKDIAERVMNEQVIRPMVDMNFGPGSYPKFAFEEPELDVFRTGNVV
jgi:phage gp29-like protein